MLMNAETGMMKISSVIISVTTTSVASTVPADMDTCFILITERAKVAFPNTCWHPDSCQNCYLLQSTLTKALDPLTHILVVPKCAIVEAIFMWLNKKNPVSGLKSEECWLVNHVRNVVHVRAHVYITICTFPLCTSTCMSKCLSYNSWL